MLLDLRSIERAYEAVPFFDRFVDSAKARLTHASILNKLPVVDGPPYSDVSALDCDDLFDDFNLKHQMMGQKEVDNQQKKPEAPGEILKRAESERLPRVEMFPVHYYEEGIQQLKGALMLRQLVAMEHWKGNRDYTVLDAIRTMISRVSRS